MSNKKIIAMTGKLASGKTTASNYLLKKYSGQRLKFSTPLRDLLIRLDLEENRNNMQEMSRIVRETFGQDILAKILSKEAGELDTDLVIVEGVRRPKDVEYLNKLDGYHLIAVDAPADLRYERLTSRNENPDDNNKTREEFDKQENADAEILIPEIMKQAEFTITNTGDVEEFNDQVDKVYKQINES